MDISDKQLLDYATSCADRAAERAARLLRRPSDKLDFRQDILLEVIKARFVEGSASRKTWIARICRNMERRIIRDGLSPAAQFVIVDQNEVDRR